MKRKTKEESVVPVREQLVELRKKRGLSQRELAELLGVTQPVVATYEKTHGIGIATAMRIAIALGARLKVSLELVVPLDEEPRSVTRSSAK